jgi:hypothetical protein
MIINILTCNPPHKRGFNDFFPLIKWKEIFKGKGIQFKFVLSHFFEEVYKCDILIVDYRYFEQSIKRHFKPAGIKIIDKGFLDDFLIKVKSRNIKTILFQNSDSALFRFIEDYDNFDVVLKKQIFSDLSWYEKPYGGEECLLWKHNGNFSPRNLPGSGPLTIETINKIRLSWNIGMLDYRKFPYLFSKYFPWGTAFISNSFYNRIEFTDPDRERHLLFSFRGNFDNNPNRSYYCYSRNLMITKLNDNSEGNYILGGKVNKVNYLKELSQSQIGLSPGGHGEICYRDFEIFMTGGLLCKTNMDHLKTWPNFYEPFETYIPFNNDYSDLHEKLRFFNENKDIRLKIAKKGQEVFKHYQGAGEEFVSHFLLQIL